MKIQERATLWNKEYGRKLMGGGLRELTLKISEYIGFVRKKFPDTPVHHSDDMLVIFRNLGFQFDPDFNAAFEFAGDEVLQGRLWRVWVISWAMSESMRRFSGAGTFLDLGTYNGKAVNVAAKYCERRNGSAPLDLRVFDAFEDPPMESRKSEHSATLHLEVKERLSWVSGCEVVKGYLPDTLDLSSINYVVWAQIDLNSADFDCASFHRIFPLLAPGSVVIFDDYGASGYHDTQVAIDKYLNERCAGSVLELPTSQGLYIR